MQKWICKSCSYTYDPAEGDPDSGIEPGTPFEAIPDDWECPVCGAKKSDFEPAGANEPSITSEDQKLTNEAS